MCELGLHYIEARGVSLDYTRGFQLCKKAADMRVDRACFVVGWCYENGRGVEKSRQKAIEYYR